jgi:HK97 family phage major capsid protein
MTDKVKDLLFARGQKVEQMKALIDGAEAENRDLNAEETAKYEALDKDQNELKARADRIESAAKLESSLDSRIDASHRQKIEDGSIKSGVSSDEYRDAFDKYARLGRQGAIDAGVSNALQVGTNSEGGFIVPQEFDTMLVEVLQDINEIRGLVNVVTTGSDRNIPVESSLGSAAWTAEEAAYNESDAAFSRVTLGAYKLTRIIKVSEELIQDSFFDLFSYLARNFGKSFGIAEEAAFINGDGSGKPTGIVQGAGAGITAAGTAAITGDELIDLFHSVTRPYRNNSTWLMNDSTVKLIRKLKDGDGQYLWQPGLQAGQPDTILARPLVASTAMPAATTGNVSVVFGDMSGYTVADRTGSTMQRLDELYAANGQIGFRMFKRMDGKVVEATGIKKLTQA